jgi:adenylosuccinate synthase
MPGIAITGLQWGDEGKGKVIDALASEADMVVRFQGGANAGHTVWVEGQKYVLHLVPSGVLYPNKTCVIGSGVVVDLESFVEELDGLKAQGIDTSRIFLSDRAHIVFPFHKRLDEAREGAAKDAAIGTTKRGIGPCYADKVSRIGLRVIELYDEKTFRLRLERLVKEKNAVLEHVYGAEPMAFDPIFERSLELAKRIKDQVCDTGLMLQQAIRRRERILFEGAQGVMLDVDHGTYPYVTSSSSSINGVSAGAGVPFTAVDSAIGVLKAYCTRVGDGPFPTEIHGEDGDALREAGGEYGATTGRPRRCGHLDLLQIRYAVNLCGVRGLALTKLDVLRGRKELKVCVAYKHGNELLTDFPSDTALLERCEPVYRSLPGFDVDISNASGLQDMPAELRRYLDVIEANAGVPVILLSTGPQRSQLLHRGHGEHLWERK